jgi:hypothetical protein
MIIINIIIIYKFKEIRDTLPQIPSSPSLICKENAIKYVTYENNPIEYVLNESRDKRLRYEFYRGVFYKRAIYQDSLLKIENYKLYNFKRSRSNSNDYLPESKRQKNALMYF